MKPISGGQAFLVAFLVVAGSSFVEADSRHWTIRGSYAITPTAPLRIVHQQQLLMDDYVVEECRIFQSDAFDHTLQWNDQTDMNALHGKPIRLEFNLKQAELFSFWFE